MMGYHDSGTNWFASFTMIVLMLAFWGLAAWVLITVTTTRSRHSSDPMEQLEERLARGDIEPEDFAERRDLLSRNR